MLHRRADVSAGVYTHSMLLLGPWVINDSESPYSQVSQQRQKACAWFCDLIYATTHLRVCCLRREQLSLFVVSGGTFITTIGRMGSGSSQPGPQKGKVLPTCLVTLAFFQEPFREETGFHLLVVNSLVAEEVFMFY